VEEKRFKVQGRELGIERVKIIQLEMLADIIGELDFGDSSAGLGDIIKIIRKQGFKKFMEIAFYPTDVSNIDWVKVDYETIDEIIEYFFVLNPRLKMRALGFLNDFLPKLVGLLTAFSKGTP